MKIQNRSQAESEESERFHSSDSELRLRRLESSVVIGLFFRFCFWLVKTSLQREETKRNSCAFIDGAIIAPKENLLTYKTPLFSCIITGPFECYQLLSMYLYKRNVIENNKSVDSWRKTAEKLHHFFRIYVWSLPLFRLLYNFRCPVVIKCYDGSLCFRINLELFRAGDAMSSPAIVSLKMKVMTVSFLKANWTRSVLRENIFIV